jgi:hypothetical protein
LKYVVFIQEEKLHHFLVEIKNCIFCFREKINFIIGWTFRKDVIDMVIDLYRIRRWSPNETREASKVETASTSFAERRRSKADIQKELAKLFHN